MRFSVTCVQKSDCWEASAEGDWLRERAATAEEAIGRLMLKLGRASAVPLPAGCTGSAGCDCDTCNQPSAGLAEITETDLAFERGYEGDV